MSKEDDIYFGEHAEAALSNPAIQAAFSRYKAKIFEQWMATGLFQNKERKDLWRFARSIDEVEQELQVMIEDANQARYDLQNKQN